MVAFVDAHREAYGVEPICALLPIAPLTYDEQKARAADPSRLPARTRRVRELREEIGRVFRENFSVYGVRKIWRQLQRESIPVARGTVARLMGQMGLSGAIRGRKFQTTKSDARDVRPADLVSRDFRADRPNQLWVADLTYVVTWSGFVYVVFVIDVFARRVVGCRVPNSLRTDLALDALERAIHARSGTLPQPPLLVCPADGPRVGHEDVVSDEAGSPPPACPADHDRICFRRLR